MKDNILNNKLINNIDNKIITLNLNEQTKQLLKYLLKQNNYHAHLSNNQVKKLTETSKLSNEKLALELVNLASEYALPAISNFFVGAVVEDLDGHFFFGANMEFNSCTMQHTLHAEQSAISHAFHHGSKGVKNIAVNYSPCGHCRQFMNDLNTSDELSIFLPQAPEGKSLSYYLPEKFGPQDLEMEDRLFKQPISKTIIDETTDKIQFHNYIKEAYNNCYAPYSGSKSATSVHIDKFAFIGKYIENAAYNPSLPSIISAINLLKLHALDETKIDYITLAQKENSNLNQYNLSLSIAQMLGVKLEVINFN